VSKQDWRLQLVVDKSNDKIAISSTYVLSRSATYKWQYVSTKSTFQMSASWKRQSTLDDDGDDDDDDPVST